MVLSSRDRENLKKKKKLTLSICSPQMGLKSAPPKLARQISVLSTHLVNSVSHAHSMLKDGYVFVWKSNDVMGNQA